MKPRSPESAWAMTAFGPALAEVAAFLASDPAGSSANGKDAPEPPDASSRAGASVVFENVGKTYRSPAGEVRALHGIGLAVSPGGIFGVIGRSGAGKSSLLRTVNRLERPTEGRVLVDGQDVGLLDEEGLIALRRRIGMIFQHFNLLSAKTVWDNVALPLKVAGVRPSHIHQRVTELLDLVGLRDKHHAYPGRLSGGQKQRVGIARALVHHPDILLCDEATSALDPETTQSILALLRDIHRRLGLTIVLITHEMSVIRAICDQVLVLEQGRIAEHGPVWQVFGDPRHDATRALLQPLEHGLPEDLLRQLSPTPPADGGERVVEIGYHGLDGIEPDLARIAAAIGAPVRLLHGGVDRIQGRIHGRLVLAWPGSGPAAGVLRAQGLCHHAKELGYVARHV